MENQSDAVVRTAILLQEQANIITSAIARHGDLENTLAPFASPVRALLANSKLTNAFDSLSAVHDLLAADGDEDAMTTVAEFSRLAARIGHAVGTGTLADVDTKRGAELLDLLVTIGKLAGVLYDVDDDANSQAATAIASWEAATATLREATQRTSRSVPSKTGTRERGAGALVEERGFRLVMTCDHCHSTFTSGSNRGSAQDQMKNHYATCNGVQVPYAGSAIHRGFTDALDAALDVNATPSGAWQGGGYVVCREYISESD